MPSNDSLKCAVGRPRTPPHDDCTNSCFRDPTPVSLAIKSEGRGKGLEAYSVTLESDSRPTDSRV